MAVNVQHVLAAAALLAARAAHAAILPRSGWTATADSEMTSRGEGAGAAIDGDESTWWHTVWGTSDPLPHQITLDLGGEFDLNALVYTPRQSESNNGNIGRYEIYVSSDGDSFPDEPTTFGTWADNPEDKRVTLPGATGVRAVRLVALTEAGGRGPWSSAAEINLDGAAASGGGGGGGGAPPVASALPRDDWTVTADSEETRFGRGDDAEAAIDGDVGTWWHTEWGANGDAHPHDFTIDLGGVYDLEELMYVPRSDGSGNGHIGEYRILVDTGSGFEVVDTGTWANTPATKTATFSASGVERVRLEALTEAGGRGPWTSAAEIYLFGEASDGSTPPDGGGSGGGGGGDRLPRGNWFALADGSEYAAATNPPSNLLDGDEDTIYHSIYSVRRGDSQLPHEIIIVFGGEVNSVTGIEVVPRNDGPNGRIAMYAVYVSEDGSDFRGAAAATGTFANSAEPQVAEFEGPLRARAVMLEVLSNVNGGNQYWASAAEVNVFGTNVQAPPYDAIGRWGPLIEMPIVPVGAAVLPDGKVLTWSSYADDRFSPRGTITQTATYNPDNGAVTAGEAGVTHDMFCPGISMLGGGEIVVTGGNTAEKTSIFRPATGTWVAGPDMEVPRGYQSSTTLSTGEIFTIGGSWSGGLNNKRAEVMAKDSTGWRVLTAIDESVINTDDSRGIYRSDNHAWLHAWSNGEVFHAGPSRQMNWFGTAGAGSRRGAGLRPMPDAMNGGSVMYDAGKILCMGGSVNYEGAAGLADAVVIELDGNDVATRTVPSMVYPGGYISAVVLPDGKVIVSGGMRNLQVFNDDNANLVPEMWDPESEEWTSLAPMGAQRTYHSLGLLLPDGRMLQGGGGLCGRCSANHFDVQLFTPPQLLLPSGAPRGRPKVSVAQDVATNGGTVTVNCNVELDIISIIRFGSATHSVNTDQRRLELCGPATTPCVDTRGGRRARYEVEIPVDPGIALPGHWMLFGVEAAGMNNPGSYSVAHTLLIGTVAEAARAEPVATRAAITPPEETAARQASASDATSGDGTAAPVDEADLPPETPADDPIPMPPGTQED